MGKRHASQYANFGSLRPINYFCYDKDNNRIIMNLDDEIQFAYLDLEGLL